MMIHKRRAHTMERCTQIYINEINLVRELTCDAKPGVPCAWTGIFTPQLFNDFIPADVVYDWSVDVGTIPGDHTKEQVEVLVSADVDTLIKVSLTVQYDGKSHTYSKDFMTENKL